MQISTVLRDIAPSNFEGLNLNAKTKVPINLWPGRQGRQGHFYKRQTCFRGVLDKAAFSTTDYCLAHSVYELYGKSPSASQTNYLEHLAFACRIDDLILTRGADTKCTDLLAQGKNIES